MRLAELEDGLVRELRHDFRRVYGCAYDDVPAGEAVDLILTLPDGSLYVRATAPHRAWPEPRHLAADVIDEMWRIAAARAGRDPGYAPRIERPGDAMRRRATAAAAKERRRSLESTSWEEL